MPGFLLEKKPVTVRYSCSQQKDRTVILHITLVQCGAPKIAKLVYKSNESNFTMVCDTQITMVFIGLISQFITFGDPTL